MTFNWRRRSAGETGAGVGGTAARAASSNVQVRLEPSICRRWSNRLAMIVEDFLSMPIDPIADIERIGGRNRYTLPRNRHPVTRNYYLE